MTSRFRAHGRRIPRSTLALRRRASFCLTLCLTLMLAPFAAPALGAQAAVAARSPADAVHRTIAVDERLASDAGLELGDRVVLAPVPGGAGDTVVVAAFTRRGADPTEVARSEYRVRLHLDQLQSLTGYGDRVDRFAIATPNDAATERVLRDVNAAAFGFRAYRSRDVAVETSRTFQVVQRFHAAIGGITIVASAIFLLCLLLLKVDERRRDVAALRLMGISRASVLRSVVLEASLVALLGSAIGAVVGWIAAGAINWHYQGVYRTPLLFALVTPGLVAGAMALSLLLGIAAGFVAALRLVRTPPLELFGR